MRTIEGEDRADYTLDVWCDHYTKPDLVAKDRLVAVAYHMPKPANSMFGFIEWRAAQIGDQPPAMRTYWDAVRELTEGMPAERRSLIMRDRAERDKALRRGNGKVMSTQRWDFYCPDCEDAFPVRYEKMTPVLEKLRDSAVPGLSMRGLRSSV